jgi:hypothetical protein
MNTLLKYEIDELNNIETESFKIDDKKQAEWALRKIKALKSQIEENNEIVQEEIFRLENWLQTQNKTAENSIKFFEGLLREFLTKENQKDHKIKSIKLPHGTFKFKKQQPEFIKDENVLVEWLKTSNKHSLIKVKETADWINLKRTVDVVEDKLVDTETGEILQGVTVVEREDKFEVVV